MSLCMSLCSGARCEAYGIMRCWKSAGPTGAIRPSLLGSPEGGRARHGLALMTGRPDRCRGPWVGMGKGEAPELCGVPPLDPGGMTGGVRRWDTSMGGWL